MSWNDRLPRVFVVIAVTICNRVAYAGVAQTCPAHAGTKLKYAGVFDGPPAEMREFKPDVSGATTGYTDVGSIFADHHLLYIQCSYRDGSSQTVSISKPVQRCRYELDSAYLVSSFVCH